MLWTPDADHGPKHPLAYRLVRMGIYAWSLVGIVVVVVMAAILVDALRLVLVPFAIALFPAALLSPIARWLRNRGWSSALTAALLVVGFVVGLVAVFGVLGWLVSGELDDVVATVRTAYDDIAEYLRSRLGVEAPEFDEIGEAARQWANGIDVRSTTVTLLEVISGVLLTVVALFFYLKDGERIGRFATQLTPRQYRGDATEIARRVWRTLGGYFQGQIVVAAVDAFFIGLGLVVLGVPLALPLAVLVFFGGLFPIVGAFVAGAVAVLVALAEGGIGLALAVLVLNIVVQQLEGNVLEPFIVGRAVRLHPLAILGALTIGGVTYGIVGAFLAVPITASLVRVASYLLEQIPDIDVEPDVEESS
jgi:putative heme transporter